MKKNTCDHILLNVCICKMLFVQAPFKEFLLLVCIWQIGLGWSTVRMNGVGRGGGDMLNAGSALAEASEKHHMETQSQRGSQDYGKSPLA